MSNFDFWVGLSFFLSLITLLTAGIAAIKKPPEKFELGDAFVAAVCFGCSAVFLIAINKIFVGW